MRRKAVQEYLRKVCEDRGGDQRKFWSTIKPYLNSCKSTNDGRIVLKDNDMIIRDPHEVAETLNNFFTSAAREVTGQAKQIPGKENKFHRSRRGYDEDQNKQSNWLRSNSTKSN